MIIFSIFNISSHCISQFNGATEDSSVNCCRSLLWAVTADSMGAANNASRASRRSIFCLLLLTETQLHF